MGYEAFVFFSISRVHGLVDSDFLSTEGEDTARGGWVDWTDRGGALGAAGQGGLEHVAGDSKY